MPRYCAYYGTVVFFDSFLSELYAKNINPPPHSKLLHYLDQMDLKSTFFVVGSRVIERPQIVVEEYMSGHELSVHTWSHRVSIFCILFSLRIQQLLCLSVCGLGNVEAYLSVFICFILAPHVAYDRTSRR